MKKLLFLLFLSTFYFLLSTSVSPVLATPGNTVGNAIPNTSWFVQDPQTWQQQTFGGDPTQMDAQRYGVFQITNLANLLDTFMGGAKTLAYDSNHKPYYTYQGGAVNFLAGLNGKMYTNPPASSIEYLADLGNNLGLTKPVYAQGMGFNNLSPLLRLWKTFRDLTYLVFVILFVVIGFMVMFRKKIDPRTVVTIQDALPQIVLALILVTFSYAIIGLMVDMMQFLSYLIVNIILVKPSNNTAFLSAPETEELLKTNSFQLVWKFWNGTGALGDSVKGVVFKFADENIFTQAIAGLTQLGVSIIFKFTLFFTMFKIFFMLLGAYIQIILATIFSPLQSVLTAMPGGQSPFAWIKSLVANLLVFPVTLTMFLIAFIFGMPTGGQLLSKTTLDPAMQPNLTWAPPLIGDWTGGGGLGPLISFGILMAIPAIGEEIKRAFEVKGGEALGGTAEKEFRGAFGGLPVIGGLFKG